MTVIRIPKICIPVIFSFKKSKASNSTNIGAVFAIVATSELLCLCKRDVNMSVATNVPRIDPIIIREMKFIFAFLISFLIIS